MTRRTVTIIVEIDTNLDAARVVERFENFLDPERLASELLGGETVRFRETTIEVDP